jgi:NAD(P)-dependent dehydrogenase (short-subunit alcohol dehydrogenase family)
MMRSSWSSCLFLFALAVVRAHSLNIAITGSSQGIGLDAAKRLVAEGHTVFHACRSQERADIAVKGAGGGVPLVCDLADFSSVRRFVEILKKEAPKLDVLCLNAGIAPSTKAKSPKTTKDGEY